MLTQLAFYSEQQMGCTYELNPGVFYRRNLEQKTWKMFPGVFGSGCVGSDCPLSAMTRARGYSVRSRQPRWNPGRYGAPDRGPGMGTARRRFALSKRFFRGVEAIALMRGQLNKAFPPLRKVTPRWQETFLRFPEEFQPSRKLRVPLRKHSLQWRRIERQWLEWFSPLPESHKQWWENEGR
uniref:Uncharacterized protein n=1 Tax=Candidatus Kentrum eta TaxID=2126337 RepID=A0A450VYR0_9GAMM|nr:MAG: hypothetical protein BECKH772B_GA0070898_104872 [Candidatus Kentron sp. H]VFK06207.1 MAG: hypothetical protein BECKH772A_GA0070896_106221 [Candidatus Kentron sp. H]VFK09954.1 MAG: hypothetical protein BECKH772C_GA0070978_106631 [Candidatus Kentron sp. H]